MSLLWLFNWRHIKISDPNIRFDLVWFSSQSLCLQNKLNTDVSCDHSAFLFQNDLDDPERGMIFVCSATHKTKSMFFFLAQTEQGDIFKVTLETDEEMVSTQN